MSDQLGKSLQHSVNQKFGTGTYQVLQPIKRGADGYVYKIQFIKQKKLGALKVLPRHNLSIEASTSSPSSKKKYKANSALDQKAQNQIKIHESLRSNYVVKLFNSCKDDMNYYMFLEYVSKGDLADEISKCANGLHIQRVRKIGLNLAKGIDTIHKKGIIHRDIKPQNILLTEEDQIKICDFSCAKFINIEKGQQITGAVGTLQYMAPQVIGKYGNSVDIWSLGCVIFALATGHPPFSISSSTINCFVRQVNEANIRKFNQNMAQQIIKKMKNGQTNKKTNETSKKIRQKAQFKCQCSDDNHDQCYLKLTNLLKKILVFNRNKRLNIHQVISHPFFTGEELKHDKSMEQQLDISQKEQQEQQVSTTRQFIENQSHNAHISRPYSLQNIKKPAKLSSGQQKKQNNKDTKAFSKTAMMVIEKHRQKFGFGKDTIDNIVTGNKSQHYGRGSRLHHKEQMNKVSQQNRQNFNTINVQQNKKMSVKQSETKKVNADDLIRHKLIDKPQIPSLQATSSLASREISSQFAPKYISDNFPKQPNSSQSCSSTFEALNCQNMNYKIELTSELVTIDEKGFKAEFYKSDKVMLISPKGRHISLSYEGKTKTYELQRLPQKYMGLYEDFRNLVNKLKQSRSRKLIRDQSQETTKRQGDTHYRPCQTSRQKQLRQKNKKQQERPLSLNKTEPQPHKITKQIPKVGLGEQKTQIQLNICLKMPRREAKRSQCSEIEQNLSFVNRISMRLGSKPNNSNSNKIQISIYNKSKEVCFRNIFEGLETVDKLRNMMIQMVVGYAVGVSSCQVEGFGKRIYELNKNIFQQWVQSIQKYIQWLSLFPKSNLQQTKQQSTPQLNSGTVQNKAEKQNYLLQKQKIYRQRANKNENNYFNSQNTNTHNKHYDHRILLDNYISKYR